MRIILKKYQKYFIKFSSTFQIWILGIKTLIEKIAQREDLKILQASNYLHFFLNVVDRSLTVLKYREA